MEKWNWCSKPPTSPHYFHHHPRWALCSAAERLVTSPRIGVCDQLPRGWKMSEISITQLGRGDVLSTIWRWCETNPQKGTSIPTTDYCWNIICKCEWAMSSGKFPASHGQKTPEGINSPRAIGFSDNIWGFKLHIWLDRFIWVWKFSANERLQYHPTS